jgi:bidirectional [NiFe] hydrogenase diaphorase subunit
VQPQLAKVQPPSDDKRWRIVDATMRRQGFEPHALIEALHAAQEAFGFLDAASMHYVAASLRVPPSRAYGVATFYNYFRLEPQGEHTCVVCMGTACYIKGSPALLAAIASEYDLDVGETTADGKLSLLTARCFGACGLAPAAVLDGEVVGQLVPATLLGRLGSMIGHDA